MLHGNDATPLIAVTYRTLKFVCLMLIRTIDLKSYLSLHCLTTLAHILQHSTLKTTLNLDYYLNCLLVSVHQYVYKRELKNHIS